MGVYSNEDYSSLNPLQDFMSVGSVESAGGGGQWDEHAYYRRSVQRMHELEEGEQAQTGNGVGAAGGGAAAETRRRRNWKGGSIHMNNL
jgi:hypothetical protein